MQFFKCIIWMHNIESVAISVCLHVLSVKRLGGFCSNLVWFYTIVIVLMGWDCLCRTEADNRFIFNCPDGTWVSMEWYCQGKMKALGKKPDPVPIISSGVPWEQTWACAADCMYWCMARIFRIIYHLNLILVYAGEIFLDMANI